jgi:hypothetical protein
LEFGRVILEPAETDTAAGAANKDVSAVNQNPKDLVTTVIGSILGVVVRCADSGTFWKWFVTTPLTDQQDVPAAILVLQEVGGRKPATSGTGTGTNGYRQTPWRGGRISAFVAPPP